MPRQKTKALRPQVLTAKLPTEKTLAEPKQKNRPTRRP
jgi:hypothetical protein